MASDASHMLEAALEQMDDIIAGSKAAVEYSNGIFDITSPIPPTYLRSLQILQLVEDLRISLEMLGSEHEREEIRNQIPVTTVQTVASWLDNFPGNHRAAVNNETCQERLTRLESDRECLVLQVSVLTDQVEAQGEKIRDLEACLEEHQLKLSTTEEMLQQELLSRTALESQKLDLMAEISSLKIKLAGLEKNHRESDELQKSENLLRELRSLKSKVEELEDEKVQYEQKLAATKAEIEDLKEQLTIKDFEIERLQSQLSSRASVQSDGSDREDMYRRRLKEKHQEVQRLKIGLDSLLASNEEKDHRIEELSRLLTQCKMMKQMMMAQGSSERILTGSSEEELSGCSMNATPTKVAHSEVMRPEVSPNISSTPVGLPLTPVEFEMRIQPRQTSASLDELNSGQTEKLSVLENEESAHSENKPYPSNSKYQTLPGKLSQSNHQDNSEQFPPKQRVTTVPNTPPVSPVDSENASVNLRETERSVDSTFSSPNLSPLSSATDTDQFPSITPESKKSTKGLKKFLGRIRRTNSSSLQDDDEGTSEFRRGGLRATAGPCLTRSKELSSPRIDPSAPFSQWTTEQICTWLQDGGLSQYVALARQWITSGQTLLSATPQELEKELGIKHPLHRKKIQVLQKTVSNGQNDSAGKLDHIWVTRWLDDIGLPQYKDQFNEARVDGRVLQYLTVNDLLFLKVTSQLHHLSIKCAIHVLHANKFHPNCLRRRPSDENHTSPSDVVQWSNHRVMEWLRSVDLAEYAPNLRGSGVHGGLLILEPRFNSETMALLLNIPPQKTLLRRHLTTHFNLLIGPEAQHEKRELIESSSYTPLNTTAKVRPKKLGFSHFGNLRKKKLDESSDYLCPPGTVHPATNGSQRNCTGYKAKKIVADRELNRLEQMEDSERAVQQIGAFSEGINNLTTLLTQDESPSYSFETLFTKEEEHHY
ncbi:liprin-beta-2-like isoform X2 [Chiloscyllium plagiosum]|uniref:liprin-beta-2-like isoform X2 n=1 Tax=Chiloscyllium plagiosum TaxID=36176 RepID=UPI001CB838E2|nr:liprin-beta-2-like isoform X2 [Chiloscyllium plagiosum]